MKKEEVIEKIGKKNWSKFIKFMEGQTVMQKHGEIHFYESDVRNFLNKLKGKPYITD